MVSFRWTIAALLACSACGSDPPASDRCASQPQFMVKIAARGSSLPADLRVSVVYGSGMETYNLSSPAKTEVLFCAPRPDDPSGGGTSGFAGRARSLECELWTLGPATLMVRAGGFAEVTRELKLNPDLCTVESSIELSTHSPMK